MAMVLDLIKLFRPKHWLKNVFVFMPLPFAMAAGEVRWEPLSFVLGLFGFCLANSAVYALNDALDAERDRMHPEKRERPVASGRVSQRSALTWSLALFLTGALLAYASSPRALVILTTYGILNLIYSIRGKHIPLVDVFLLSSGFVLRVLLGCALVAVQPSNWLLLCSSALALFLALAKRRGDLLKGLDQEHRPSLAGYSERFVEQAMGMMSGMTVIAYALYCTENAAEVLIEGREFASLPFVVFGVLEYLRVAHVRSEGGSPVETLLRSPAILLCGMGWLGATIWSVKLF